MPMLHTEAPSAPAPRFAVRGSIAVELEWALAAGEREDWRGDHSTLEAVYGADPELLQRVKALWGPDHATECGCGFMELSLLAYAGDRLFTLDAEAFLDDLDRMCTLPFDEEGMPLASETHHDRGVLMVRLAKLRDDAEFRTRYVTLMRDLWAALRPDWDRFGRAVVESSIASKSEFLAKGGDWRAVVGNNCDFSGMRDQMIDALGADGEAVIVPAFFTHVSLIFDLPGTLILGIRPDATAADARSRTEALARRLKAISDPTRLAIVDTLRSGPRTVTELASAFDLAQPTVSNHVKLLRDAGLVTDSREGTRRKLAVQADVADELLASLQHILVAAKPKALTPTN